MISEALWASELFTKLQGNGYNGSHLFLFCSAIAFGSAAHLRGSSFTTADSGLGPGIGVGTGTGLHVSSSVFQGSFLASMILLFQISSPLPQLIQLSKALGDTFENQMNTVTFTSAHSPVFSGNGIIQGSSMSVSASGWQSSLQSFGSVMMMNGSDWPKYCQAIGIGYMTAVNSSFGNVSISGTPTTLFPIPIIGNGSGTIS